jgi:hypothetical protein
MGTLKRMLTDPKEVRRGFVEVTFEHGLTEFVEILRRLRRKRMHGIKTYTNQYTYRGSQHKKPC